MGSTICVRCGANLVPHSYCDICHEMLGFICSSCSMNTIERVHANCYDTCTLSNNNDNVYLQDSQNLMEEPTSSLLAANDNYYIQNQLHDKMKDNSINLSTSYWNNMFETMKMVNTYWSQIFNVGNSSSSIARW